MKKSLFLRSIFLLLSILTIFLIFISIYSCFVLRNSDVFYSILIVLIMFIGLSIFLTIAMNKIKLLNSPFDVRQNNLVKFLCAVGAILISALALYSLLLNKKQNTFVSLNDLFAIIFFGIGGIVLFLLKKETS